MSGLCQRQREVRGNRGFSHSALAACHRDHVFDAVDLQRSDIASRSRRSLDINFDVHGENSPDTLNSLQRFIPDLHSHLRLAGGYRDLDLHISLVDPHLAHEPE